ncbi:MAG: hypothetical protein ACC663_03770 [Gammaproteobacteria bacterium]
MQPVSLSIRTGFILAAMVFVAGCAASSSRYGARPSVDPASVVQVRRQFEIPDSKARVYIQQGIPVTMRDFNKRRTYCSLLMQKALRLSMSRIDKRRTYCSLLMQNLHVSGEPRLTISPGRFNITKVLQFNDLRYFRRVFVAARSWTYDPPSDVIYQVEMRLKSAEQPGVRALICVKHVDNYRQNYPTLAEIRIALGDAIEIIPPQ